MSQLSAQAAPLDVYESGMRQVAGRPRQAGTLFPFQGSCSLKPERGRKICTLKSLMTTFPKALRNSFLPLQEWTSREGKEEERTGSKEKERGEDLGPGLNAEIKADYEFHNFLNFIPLPTSLLREHGPVSGFTQQSQSLDGSSCLTLPCGISLILWESSCRLGWQELLPPFLHPGRSGVGGSSPWYPEGCAVFSVGTWDRSLPSSRFKLEEKFEW